MVVSDAAAIVILALAGATGTLLVLGSNLRWDRARARLRERLRAARPRFAARADALRRGAPEAGLREGAH